MAQWLRAVVWRGAVCFACAMVGAGVGILINFPNLVAGAFSFRPGTVVATPIGCCAGGLIWGVWQFMQFWNRTHP